MLSKRDWKSIIYRNGKIKEGQVMKELLDYGFLMEQASKVYDYICGLSKTNYFASTIISELDNRFYDKGITQDDLSDIIKNCPTKKELIKEIKEYFEI